MDILNIWKNRELVYGVFEDDSPKTRSIAVRLSEEVYQLLEKQAKHFNSTISDEVRRNLVTHMYAELTMERLESLRPEIPLTPDRMEAAIKYLESLAFYLGWLTINKEVLKNISEVNDNHIELILMAANKLDELQKIKEEGEK